MNLLSIISISKAQRLLEFTTAWNCCNHRWFFVWLLCCSCWTIKNWSFIIFFDLCLEKGISNLEKIFHSKCFPSCQGSWIWVSCSFKASKEVGQNRGKIYIPGFKKLNIECKNSKTNRKNPSVWVLSPSSSVQIDWAPSHHELFIQNSALIPLSISSKHRHISDCASPNALLKGVHPRTGCSKELLDDARIGIAWMFSRIPSVRVYPKNKEKILAANVA